METLIYKSVSAEIKNRLQKSSEKLQGFEDKFYWHTLQHQVVSSNNRPFKLLWIALEIRTLIFARPRILDDALYITLEFEAAKQASHREEIVRRMFREKTTEMLELWRGKPSSTSLYEAHETIRTAAEKLGQVDQEEQKSISENNATENTICIASLTADVYLFIRMV
ncbi:hypothetical protein FQR65_LT02984 [Abscondita terminalis]|nr:hypothetical protein FQR65_LT02984 [Abscondita terminalis]